MTPEEARKLLDGTTPRPWRVCALTNQPAGCPEETEFWIENTEQAYVAEKIVASRRADEIERDFNLMAAAPELAATIAGMTPEYAVEIKSSRSGEWHRITEWSTDLNLLRIGFTLSGTERVVVRYVTEPQLLEENQ